METCANDNIVLILKFLYLQDIYSILTLSKKLHQKSKYILKTLNIKQLFQSNMDQLLEGCGLNLKEFYLLLQKESGIITGSIHIENLLGQDTFQANDIDVFVKKSDKNQMYSPLHQYIFEVSTGYKSHPSIHYTKKVYKEYRQKIKRSLTELLVEPEFQKHEYKNGLSFYNAKANWSICSVETYKMPKNNRNIQIITLLTDPNLHFFDQRAWSLDIPLDTYVQSYFDFRCCTSTYDGQSYHLRFLKDVVYKSLIVDDNYLELAKFFPPTRELKHLERIEKYKIRNFKLCDSNYQLIDKTPVQYGLHLKDIEEQSYILHDTLRNVDSQTSREIDRNTFIEGIQSNKRRKIHV